MIKSMALSKMIVPNKMMGKLAKVINDDAIASHEHINVPICASKDYMGEYVAANLLQAPFL